MDEGKKLRRGRLIANIFRKKGTKGSIEMLAIKSEVDNWRDRRKAILPESNCASTALAQTAKNENKMQ